MKIDIWSDFACPFCYIGKHHLEQAISQVPNLDISIVYHSFELDPQAPLSNEATLYEVLAQKYQISLDRAKAMTKQVLQKAHEAGLSLQFDSLVSTRTFDAHRLAHFATDKGYQDVMQERLFKAYLTDSMNLADRAVLLQLAKEVGLDAKQTQQMLESDQYAKAVRADEAAAKGCNVTGVPFFVFDEQYAVSGAQPVSVFVDILSKAQQAEPLSQDGLSCDNDGCAI
ncbi:DsbA family oxidoreductase [Neisseria sp. Ec49-e6-T10]|uniref:DsbA family oxidoreductase n=1 Tax=Neisseria sp. Ec49-e6-T10 TaxID=3140744 RepID=UPI003EBFD6DD